MFLLAYWDGLKKIENVLSRIQ